MENIFVEGCHDTDCPDDPCNDMVPVNVDAPETDNVLADISEDVMVVFDMFPDMMETFARSRLTKSILSVEPLKSRDDMDTEFTVMSSAEMVDAWMEPTILSAVIARVSIPFKFFENPRRVVAIMLLKKKLKKNISFRDMSAEDGGETSLKSVLSEIQGDENSDVLGFIINAYGHLPLDHFIYYFPDDVDYEKNILTNVVYQQFRKERTKTSIITIMENVRNHWHQAYIGIVEQTKKHARELRNIVSTLLLSSSESAQPLEIIKNMPQQQQQQQQHNDSDGYHHDATTFTTTSPFHIISSEQLLKCNEPDIEITELEYTLRCAKNGGWLVISIYHGLWHILEADKDVLSQIPSEVLVPIIEYRTYYDATDAYNGKKYMYREINTDDINDPILKFLGPEEIKM